MQRLDDRSRMSGDVHVRFCESLRGRFPRATRLVVHCKSKAEAEKLKVRIAERLGECGLELHPEKTNIVYCRDANRTGDYPVHSFDFLGFCFRPRLSRNRRGRYFVNFSPAIAPKSKKAIYATIRQMSLHRRSDLSMEDLSTILNEPGRAWLD